MTENMTSGQLLYGFSEKPAAQIRLRAGPFNMIYENGFLRYIKYGSNEIIRMIYMALRDKNWGTYTPLIENEKLDISLYSFDIEYTCRYEENSQIFFIWNATIKGDEQGKIIFTIKGKTLKDTWKNRAGFCILHPIINTAGQPLTAINTDGAKVYSCFPLSISPVNPFLDICKLQWQNRQREYVLEMTGEAFEMEDQRNWTDTSFKTFCTPLKNPYPVLLKAGTEIDQQVCFYPIDALQATAEDVESNHIQVTIDESAISTLPAIGVGASTEILYPGGKLLNAQQGMKWDHYSVDIQVSRKGWQQILQSEIRIAEQLQTSLFVVLELTDQFALEFSEFADLTARHKNLLKYILVTTRDEPVTIQKMIEWCGIKIKEEFDSVLIGIGTSTNFAELNRNRRTVNNIDFISYAIHPQEHAFDNLSLIENLASQADTVLCAKQIYPRTGVCISPVTLRKRFNPYAQNSADREQTNGQKADPRQISLWAAGWTLASIKHLSETAVMSATYFQTGGKQGVCDAEGKLYPIASLLKSILDLKDATVIKTTVSEPLQCSSLLLAAGNKKYLFLTNHTDKALTVKLPYLIAVIDNVELFPSHLSTSNIAATDLLELSPYCTVKLS
jgi:phosphopantetheine adenylyltransferase